MRRFDRFSREDGGLLIVPESVDKQFVTWNLGNILEGFRYFFELNNRWPIHTDLQECRFLPTAKSIERKFGGIKRIRGLLGLQETDLARGVHRSGISKRIWARGRNLEQIVYKELLRVFHEPFVHNQSRFFFLDKEVRVDFLVYHQGGKFAVDVFHADENKARYKNNIRMKLLVYKNFPEKLFIVSGNPEIAVETGRSNNQGENTQIMDLPAFLQNLSSYRPLRNPYDGS